MPNAPTLIPVWPHLCWERHGDAYRCQTCGETTNTPTLFGCPGRRPAPEPVERTPARRVNRPLEWVPLRARDLPRCTRCRTLILPGEASETADAPYHRVCAPVEVTR